MTKRASARRKTYGIVASLCLVVGCIEREKPREKPLSRAADVTVCLREDFAVTERVTCQVTSAEPVLTEVANQAPFEDLLVAKLTLACRDEQGRELSAREALPEAAILSVRDTSGHYHAPSLRTRISEHEPDALVFEVPDATLILPTPHRYAAESGERLGKRAVDAGALRITLHERVVDVELRERALDAAFARFLDELARSVTRPGAADDSSPLGRVRALYVAARERFQPRVLALRDAAEHDGALRITLALEDSPLRDAPHPVASFVLHAKRSADGVFALTELVDAESTKHVIACADRLHALDEEVEQAFRKADKGRRDVTCNALGVLVPGPCPEGGKLLADALALREACVALPALGRVQGRKVPDDFQLTLRRGKKGSGLDREPRYVLALFAGGQVVFHGRHWVSALGRSDGRTTQAVLAALYARFQELAWFERRGGSWDPANCAPDQVLGNVLTLHAGGRQRMIVDRDGCRGPFTKTELDALMAAVESAAGLNAWTTPKPGYVDTGVEVWTIADEDTQMR